MPDEIALTALLVHNEHNGVYHLPASGRKALERAAHKDRIPFVPCDLGDDPDVTGALQHIGRSFDFPDTYGSNFDALHDYLTDLSWQAEPGAVLLLSGCDRLQTESPEAFTTLLEVCGAAADYWRAAQTPFWVFVDMKANGLAPLPTVT